MNMLNSSFYTDIPVFGDFAKVVDDTVYRPMPDDWFIGITDVVESTVAIENGQYKAVNMAGAAAISAVINAFGHQDFPFVFGGDGVRFAVLSTYATPNPVRPQLRLLNGLADPRVDPLRAQPRPTARRSARSRWRR